MTLEQAIREQIAKHPNVLNHRRLLLRARSIANADKRAIVTPQDVTKAAYQIRKKRRA